MVELREITNKEYQSDEDYERCTGLKLAYKSMFQYYEYKKGLTKDTPALSFGRLYHTVLEGQDKFSSEFAVIDKLARPEPDKTMASKMNKEWLEVITLRAEADGKQVCTMEDYEKAVKMRDVLNLFVAKNESNEKFSVFNNIVETGVSEMSLFCDDYLGVKVKCRSDLTLPYMLVDYKSVADASQHKIELEMLKWGWDIQVALYSDLHWMFQSKTNDIPESIRMPFYLTCQEKKEPYDFNFYNASDFYYTGKVRLLKAIANIKAGASRGYWGDIPKGELGVKLKVPKWAYEKLNFGGDIDETE